MQSENQLKTFRHSYRKGGFFLGIFRIDKEGKIYPKDKAEESMIMKSDAFKAGSVLEDTEDTSKKRSARFIKASDGVVISAPPIFELFSTAEKHELKKLTPSSKNKIYNLAVELVKLELGTDWEKRESEKLAKRRVKKEVKLIEIPAKATLTELKKICKSQLPPIVFDTQAKKEEIIKLIDERNKEIALSAGESKTTENKKEESAEIPKEGKRNIHVKKHKIYKKEEIEKLKGEELDNIFNEHGLDSEGLAGDEEKRETLISYFENISKES